MKNYKIKVGDKQFIVRAHDKVEAVRKLNDAQTRKIVDAGWFSNKYIELDKPSDLTLGLIVNAIKKATGQPIKKIMNGKASDNTLRLQIYTKNIASNEYEWMEIPLSFRIAPKTLKNGDKEDKYFIYKMYSELENKIKSYAGKTLYEDKTLVADKCIADRSLIKDCEIGDARPDRDTVFKIEGAAWDIRTNNVSVKVRVGSDKDGVYIKDMYISALEKRLETPQEAATYLRDLSNVVKFLKENYKYLGK